MNKGDLTTKYWNKSTLFIYYSAYLRFLFTGLLLYFAVVFTVIAGVNFFYPGSAETLFPGLFAGLISVHITSQARGMQALRQAGLLHEEDVRIERTVADTGGGPTIEMPASSSSKWVMITVCLLLCAALIGVIFISSDSRLFQIICAVVALVMGGIAVAIWRSKKQPEVRLDDGGVFVSSDGLDRKLVPWRRIACVRFQRVATAPNFGIFSFFEADTSEIITLENSDGKTLLALNALVFKNSPAIKARFLAEIERRLTATTPPPNEGEFR